MWTWQRFMWRVAVWDGACADVNTYAMNLKELPTAAGHAVCMQDSKVLCQVGSRSIQRHLCLYNAQQHTWVVLEHVAA